MQWYIQIHCNPLQSNAMKYLIALQTNALQSNALQSNTMEYLNELGLGEILKVNVNAEKCLLIFILVLEIE